MKPHSSGKYPSPGIDVYWHLTNLPGAIEIFSEQLAVSRDSGLEEHAERIFLCINGDPSEYGQLRLPPKFRILEVCGHHRHFEYHTLTTLRRHAVESSHERHVLYLHLKGSSHPGNPNVRDWRAFLNWAVIERWEECREKLEHHDCVGPNWETSPWPHFSGNFWWARASYIRRLPTLIHPEEALEKDITMFERHVGGGQPYFRFDHEAFVGSADPAFCEIAKSLPIGAMHYGQPYPRELYAPRPGTPLAISNSRQYELRLLSDSPGISSSIMSMWLEEGVLSQTEAARRVREVIYALLDQEDRVQGVTTAYEGQAAPGKKPAWFLRMFIRKSSRKAIGLKNHSAFQWEMLEKTCEHLRSRSRETHLGILMITENRKLWSERWQRRLGNKGWKVIGWDPKGNVVYLLPFATP